MSGWIFLSLVMSMETPTLVVGNDEFLKTEGVTGLQDGAIKKPSPPIPMRVPHVLAIQGRNPNTFHLQ